MVLYWKTAAGILVGLVLILTLGKQEKDLSMLLGMAVCGMAAMAALTILEPVLDFLYRLQALGNVSESVLRGLLKITGIGLVTELTGMLCQDSGSGSLGRGIQLLGAATILMLSLPVFEILMELVTDLLGGI